MADPYAAFEDVDDPYAQFEDVSDQPTGRFGDFLKPVFGGHNPIAETFDTFVKPFVAPEPVESDRMGVERIGDTAAFAASLPVRMVTRGEYGAGDIVGAVAPETGERIAQGEQDFIAANPDELKALQALGEATAGTIGVTAPRVNVPRPAPSPRQVRQAATPQSTQVQPAMLPDAGPARARAYVRDLDELNISRHGPAIAQAGRDAENIGTIAKVTENLPIVGRDLQQSTRSFVETAARSADETAGRFAPGGGDLARAGGRLGTYLDEFKNERAIPRDSFMAMDDAQVRAVANRPVPELGSLKNAQDARYELAIRQIPEDMRRGGTQGRRGFRLMIQPERTRAVLADIRGRSQGMLPGDRASDAAPASASDPIASGGFLGNIIRGLENDRRGYNVQNLRNIRSEIRRRGSKIADTEGAALTRADLSRLESALTQDLREGVTAFAERARREGHNDVARNLEEAGRLFQQADSFTRRTAEAWGDIQRLTKQSTEGRTIAALVTAANKGKSGDRQLLRSYRRIVSQDVRNDVAAAAIHYMGAPTKQAGSLTKDAGFSLSKFSREFLDMSDDGLQSLFGHRPEHLERLRKLANVGKGMDDYEKLANVSRSGTHTIAGAIVLYGPAALLANVGNVAMAAGAAYGVNRFMTSPAYVAWLTRSTNLQRAFNQGRLTGRQAVRAAQDQALRLRRIVTRDRTIDPEAQRAILLAIDQGQDNGR